MQFSIKKGILSAVMAATLALGIPAVSACDVQSYIRIGYVESSFGDHIKADYHKFSGNKIYTAKVKEDGAISVNIKSESGILKVEIVNKETLETVYEGNFTEDFAFKVNVSAGAYKIELTAKDHKGGFEFTW